MTEHTMLRFLSHLHRFAVLCAGLIGAAQWTAHAAVDPGEILIAEMNCVACHDVTEPIRSRLASRPSPRLDATRAVRVSPTWIRTFLENPQTTQPGTLMPDLLAHLEEPARAEAAEALTHFLVELRGPSKPVSGASSPDMIQQGKALYHSVGCVACHAPVELPATASRDSESEAELERLQKMSVPLGSLTKKYTPGELAAFLQDPLQSRPGGRMPSLKLSATEARAIAVYLLWEPITNTTGSEPPFIVEPAKAARGKELYTSLNCASCHEGDGQGKQAKPLARLNGRQPTGCLGPRPKAGVPRFEITDRQRVVILAQLGHQEVLNEPLTPEQQITRTMTTLNCYACHARERRGGIDAARRGYFTSIGSADLGDEGRIPPTLHEIGAKLRPDWIKAVLVEGASARSFMATRMPLYGEANIAHLPSIFEQADVRPEALPDPKLPTFGDSAVLRAASQMLGTAGLNCVSCHSFNGHPSSASPGVDLTTTAQRLRWDWFRRFLLDPTSFHSETRMPFFWPNGTATHREFFQGDTEKQLSALWEYLARRDFAVPPPGLPPVETRKPTK